MGTPKVKGEQVRAFLLAHVTAHPKDIATVACDEFGLTRPTVFYHLKQLVEQGKLKAAGKTRN